MFTTKVRTLIDTRRLLRLLDVTVTYKLKIYLFRIYLLRQYVLRYYVQYFFLMY